MQEKLFLRPHSMLGEPIPLNNHMRLCWPPLVCVSARTIFLFFSYTEEHLQHDLSLSTPWGTSNSRRSTKCSASSTDRILCCQQDPGGTTKGLVKTLTAGVKPVRKRAAQGLPKAAGLGLEQREMETGTKNAFPTVLT